MDPHYNLPLLRKTKNVNVADCNGNTPMMRAAMYGHVAIVEKLLEHGANVAIYNKDGVTAVDYTIELGHHEFAEKLKANRRKVTRVVRADARLTPNDRHHVQILERCFLSIANLHKLKRWNCVRASFYIGLISFSDKIKSLSESYSLLNSLNKIQFI